MLRSLSIATALLLGGALVAYPQIDPYPRSLLQLGYDPRWIRTERFGATG